MELLNNGKRLNKIINLTIIIKFQWEYGGNGEMMVRKWS